MLQFDNNASPLVPVYSKNILKLDFRHKPLKNSTKKSHKTNFKATQYICCTMSTNRKGTV